MTAASFNRPTMQDVADRVGVSKALVSLVFRNAPGPSAESRRRIIDAADELGYRVNRAAALMTARRTHLIGVVADIGNTFHAHMAELMVDVADSAGYEVVLGAVTSTRTENVVHDTMLSFRCEALILLGPLLTETQLSELGRRLPVVVVGRRTRCHAVDVVRTADGRGIGKVVDHLVESGHRRISHIGGGLGTISSDRRAGYVRAMKRHGLSDAIDIVEGDLTESAGVLACRTLLQRKRLPTAVVAANDRSGIGLLDELLRSGVRIPHDISVAGYDDSALARLAHIDLTSVSQEPQRQAESAVKAVVDRLDNHRLKRIDLVLEPHLILRTTTRSLR